MKNQNIRLNFHHLIDEIENEKILSQFYELLSGFKKEKKKIDFWDLFTSKQKQELEIAWEESESETNLIDHIEVKKEVKKWLKK